MGQEARVVLSSSPSVSLMTGLMNAWVPPFLSRMTNTRSKTPTCTAEIPTPPRASMVSLRSVTSSLNSSERAHSSVTSSDTCFSSGFGHSNSFSIAMAYY